MRTELLLLATALSACAAPRAAKVAPPSALTFLEDDYPRALASARERKLPIFVDAWVPW